MDLNASSFFESEETSQTRSQLNSTAVDQDRENQQQNEWKLSPIIAEENRSSIFKNRQIHVSLHGSSSLKNEFKSPLKSLNSNSKMDEVSGYETKSTVDSDVSGGENEQCSTSQQFSHKSPSLSFQSADLSSLITNKSLHPFDSLVMNSLHKSLTFSPRVIFSTQSTSNSNDGEKFQWSLEQLAILKPAHISEDEIAANYHSPIPEVEEKVQEALNEYWSKNVSYIPSPDGPRFVHLPSRDGNVTTIMYESEENVKLSSSKQCKDATPSLCDVVRKKEAVKAAYATSSPKQRLRRNIRKMQCRNSQTDVTIPPSMDFDLKKILGEGFIYEPNEEDDVEEVFDVSMSSNVSMRRRLFSANDDEEANSSLLSCDNMNDSQRFNDSLSPVRREDENDKNEENNEEVASSNDVSRSHRSQIAINISILNDCMMQSIDQEEEEEFENNDKENEENLSDENRLFHDDQHLKFNEFSILDESCATVATPKREDLDWTPRRIPEKSCGSSRLHEFMFELSPINPKKLLTPKDNNK